MAKQFYVLYVPDFDSSEHSNKSPQELTNDEFKAIAEEQEHVYTPEELCAEWNSDSLPVIDSYVRLI
jgi:hypothetical protein